MTPEEPIAGSDGITETLRPAYDVCNPDRLPAERVTFVDAIHLQFLQAFALELSTYLDTPVETEPGGLDQAPVSAFLDGSAADACVMALDLSPMRGQAWVGLSAKFVFRVLDILLGAPQTSAPAARATITEIEQNVLHEFFHTLLTALDKAWSPSGISLRMAAIASAEEVRQTADPDGTAVVLHCKIKIGVETETFRVAVPVLAVRLAALQSEQSAVGQMSGETAARAALLNVVRGASMQIEAVLAGSFIRLGDLAAMQPGQILVLTQPAGSHLDCLVNGKAKFRGEWIEHGDHHGLQLDSLV